MKGGQNGPKSTKKRVNLIILFLSKADEFHNIGWYNGRERATFKLYHYCNNKNLFKLLQTKWPGMWGGGHYGQRLYCTEGR